MKPVAGDYLFIHYGYNATHAPALTLLGETGSFVMLTPRDQELTLTFNNDQRFCTGWHDLASAQSHPCPDKATLPDQYEQCRHCQIKTGFNPAFYNTDAISKQQAARNLLPHSLYLAHFAPGVVKVGITWAERGIRRLLDQGARSCLIIKTFPTANVARNYEAQIAKLSGIAETIQGKAKVRLLDMAYDPAQGAQELLAARERIIKEVGLTPENNPPQHLDEYYLNTNQLTPGRLIHLHEKPSISGKVLGMIGSTLVTAQDELQYLLPLSKWRGYRVAVAYEQTANEHQPHQATLF